MQHLDSVIIHNFKSFKHVNIKFSQGFNCIVGANGSGKSNICDSLLFALGESSLKRMRVQNAGQLINSFAKPRKEDNVKRAYVKINFAGQTPMEVARVIKSNNKMGYRLNGKHVSKQEVVDALRGCRSEINETNIIAQGEISYMTNLNAKERRELIDVAAGIKEFNDKKDTSMKEMEKVQEKINMAEIALSERKGFLNQLEREKEDAEKYLQLTDNVKRITYTLLKNSERQAESDFNSIAERLKDVEQKRQAANASMSDIDLMIEKLSKDKAALTKTLNERSVELSSTNRILEEVNKNTAVKQEQIKSLKEKLDESKSRAAQLREEQKRLQKESAEQAKQSESLNAELKERSALLKSKESMEMDAGSSQIERMGANQKRINELYAQSESMSKQYLQYKFELDEIQKSTGQNGKELAAKSSEYESLSKKASEKAAALDEYSKQVDLAARDIEALKKVADAQQKLMDSNYTDSVNVREQLAISGGSSDKLNAFLKKSMKSGFYGRAYELCTYDDKYAMAVNSAASSRLNYLVVESAEHADSAIRLLKEKQLGRASFIPIKDMAARQKDDNKKLDRLIEHVKFDKKFESAFSYIFANTYVVSSIQEAKSIGFGKGRFVTLEGELVEQSGVITGGSMRQTQSPAILENKLRALEEQKSEISRKLSELSSQIESRARESASMQVNSMGCKVELAQLNSTMQSLKSVIDSSDKRASDLETRLKKLNESYAQADSKRNSILEELNSLKEENEKIYSTTGSTAKQKSKGDKSELEALKALRAEAEQLKIKLARLAAEQQLKGARLQELESQIKSGEDDNAETRKRMAILDSELIELDRRMKDVRTSIGKSDSNSQDLYKRIRDQDSTLSKLAADRGKNQAEMEKSNRDLIEQETRKVQLQTRITDIKAELVSYSGISPITGQTDKELEAKRTIARSDLERLGAVNLKAPEVYETKKKDVEEVLSKIDVLGNEKDSIITMINEIESRKLSIFTETLGDVNENFKRLYGYVFEGSAQLELDNPKDPFNSGLLVKINSPKNKNSTVETLSGGEKTLVIIMLIFAIQSHDPMSLYLFDEVDASLDKENSKKLSRLMKEISKKSQLIVISHNDSLITAADTAIGVVHRNRESRVVGLQLTESGSVVSAR